MCTIDVSDRTNIWCYVRIDDKLRVKVTDSGLSRDLFPIDYHCLGDNENRPIKWLALESLVHRQFTLASDVVSVNSDKSVFNYTCQPITRIKNFVNNLCV